METDLQITEIFVSASGTGSEFQNIVEIATKRKIRLVKVSKFDLEKMAPDANHQGVVAFYTVAGRIDLESILSKTRDDEYRLFLVLDGIEDPGNFGAIVRSAEVLGATAIIYRKRRAVGVTPLAVKASAGAMLRFPIIEVGNLDQAVQKLKKNAFWIFALDMGGEKSIWEVDFPKNTCIILGNEGKGVSKLLLKRSDEILSVPQIGKISSLNVSVTAGIVLAECLRRRE